MTHQTPQSKVSRITIGRLYNLGNYEHIRYELAVDVPDGASATAAFTSMVRLLRAVNPKAPCTKYELQSAKDMLAKSADHLNVYERERLDEYRARVKAHEEWMARRAKAVSLFDAIGGKAIEVDAKDSWEDEQWEEV